MGDTLRHRGPDADGVWVDGPVGLAHRRLSVLDLSAAGRQPMGNEDGDVQVCYNGEIYNFDELRRELEAHGHVFRSATDTEVIVHAWEQWGRAAWARFNGMFAFALWDARMRCLVLVRDRLGVKPLYVHRTATQVVFGSELKALLAWPETPRDIDPTALDAFLAFNYVPGPRTIWRGIESLPPGHDLIVTAETARLEPWWDVHFGEQPLTNRPDAVQQIRALCHDAVRARLVSDVPLGAFLSGGLDSSAIVHHMRPHHSGPLHTFSVRFGEASFDEGPFAALVARRYDLHHHEVVCTADDVRTTLDRVVWHADNPTADISMVPMLRLSEAARREVTVVLSGDGGDEIFGGYPIYQADRLARVWRHLPGWFRRGIAERLVDRLPTSQRKLSVEYALRAFVGAASLPPEEAHARWRLICSDAERAALLGPDVWQQVQQETRTDQPFLDAYLASGAPNLIDRMFYVDIKTFLADSILPKVDRMTMAFGLEARTPWLDYRLVELGARVPVSWKVTGLDTKRIFKDAMRGHLPDAIVRRRKAGFHAPLAAWFRGPLRDLVHTTLARDAVQALPLLQPDAVARLVREHLEGHANHAFKLWGLMTLVRWRVSVDMSTHQASSIKHQASSIKH
jgi:asparagine synthase (glutamine-hydrolysing)